MALALIDGDIRRPRGLVERYRNLGRAAGHRREVLGADRFVGQIDLGGLPSPMVRRSIELLATEVAPVVRRETRTPTENTVAPSAAVS